MNPFFQEVKFLILNGWNDLANTNFSQIKYSETELAVSAGLVIASLIILKLIFILLGRWFKWENYSHKNSGHFISGRFERGVIATAFLRIPKIVLLIPLSAILMAIADPNISVVHEEKVFIHTRTRLVLQDVSGSMATYFKETKQSKAEVAMRAHLKFLDLRRGKNDRVAFWLFSNNPYPIQEDFLIDDDLMYLKVYDAPWELGPGVVDSYNWSEYAIPKTRYLQVAGQGGTQLAPSLNLAIKLFDSDEKKQLGLSPYAKTAGRALIIITDAAIDDFRQTQDHFSQLRKRGIRPYIIYIDEQKDQTDINQILSVIPLLEEVVKMGGKIFVVSNEGSMENAYREIDRLEKVKTAIQRNVFKIPVFQKFIFIAIISLWVAIVLGLFAELFNYP